MVDATELNPHTVAIGMLSQLKGMSMQDISSTLIILDRLVHDNSELLLTDENIAKITEREFSPHVGGPR